MPAGHILVESQWIPSDSWGTGPVMLIQHMYFVTLLWWLQHSLRWLQLYLIIDLFILHLELFISLVYYSYFGLWTLLLHV